MVVSGKKSRRLSGTYQNLSEKYNFASEHRTFNAQYSQLYSARLEAMRDSLLKAAREKWGNNMNYCRLMELKTGEESCIIGTLFKRMDARPNILQEISDEHNLIPIPPRIKYTDESDELVLEDDTQRISLTGDIAVEKSVTGVIVALAGLGLENGKFQVSEMVYAGLPSQIPRPIIDNDKYVCIISGLMLGSDNQDFLALQLFLDYVSGRLADGKEDQTICSQIVRIVIAGNSICQRNVEASESSKGRFSNRSMVSTIEGVKGLDDALVQLGSCVSVDIMPGEFDPSNHIMPQQPLHPCMFPRGFQFSTVKSVTNPYEFSFDGIRFLGTSGQNVDDVYRYSLYEDRLEISENCLKWGHISPTSPDTLACYPYYEKDPFVLHQCPHIYFVGNQPKFSARTIKGEQGQEILLVNVPSFTQTASCALVNIRTLQCIPLSFGVYGAS